VWQLFESLDRLLLGHARELGAEPQVYPVLVEARTLMQSGYLKSFPHHAVFVAPVAQNLKSLQKIGTCSEPGELDEAGRESVFAAHDRVLAPTVCYPCMEALRGTRLISHRSYTAMNPCHRSEALARDALDRLECFRMREVISFGDEAYVARLLETSFDYTRQILVRWGIAHQGVTATDPFFAGAAGKRFFQATFALKRELRVRTDFDGQWLSIASFNNHQRSLTRSFGIEGPNGPLHSGCVGWGFERLLYGLMCQLGTDCERWPAVVRADLGF
jgi:seryl-tRNA synthetase